jgi:hypothetical protein
MTISEEDPFDGLEIDEIAALVLHQTGTEGLQALVDMFLDNKTMDRDGLLDIASRLDDGGLSDGADLIRKAAEHAPSKKVAGIAWILNHGYPCNIRFSLTHGAKRGKWGPEDMEAAGVDPVLIDEIAEEAKAYYEARKMRACR